MQDPGCGTQKWRQGERASCHISQHLFALSSIFQVYVSYDYGKSFQRISEKFNFGVGNSSEAVIAQFYHSPADNKRVRKLFTCWGFMRLYFGVIATQKGGLGDALSSLQHAW